MTFNEFVTMSPMQFAHSLNRVAHIEIRYNHLLFEWTWNAAKSPTAITAPALTDSTRFTFLSVRACGETYQLFH